MKNTRALVWRRSASAHFDGNLCAFGGVLPGAYYLKAQKVRRLIRNDFIEAFKQCDVVLTPTATSTAFGIGEKDDDPIQMYLTDVFTVTLNLAGLPGMSVPIGLAADGLPMGTQMIGRPFEEETLFKVGAALERR